MQPKPLSTRLPLHLVLLLALVLPFTLAHTPRVLTITNRCSEPYWFLPVAGSAPFSSPSITACASDAGCIAGSSCLLPGTALCFWELPTVSSGVFRVDPGDSAALTFPFVDNGVDVHWSGNIGFCQRGACGDFPPADTERHCDARGCTVNAGPGNSAELTLSKAGTDFYDVSNIAGVNAPLSFGPRLTSATLSLSAPYTCGTAGSASSAYPSSWTFEPPSVHYQWVTSGGAECSADGDCAAGELCGLTNVPGRAPQFALECGRSLGYWTANSACAAGVDLPESPFDCSERIDALTRCSEAIGSCYQPGATSACCGCADWQSVLSAGAVPASTSRCLSSNPLWTERVLPQLAWLKAGAPNAYTYPFDDMSSTFICSQKNGVLNHIDYDIVLCPAQDDHTD